MNERLTTAVRLGRLAAIVAVLAAAAAVVQWPYRTFPHVADDLDHLSGVAKIHRGEQSLASFALTPHGPHWIPLWKTWYYLQWNWSELAVGQWHLSLFAAHVLSAAFVYCVLTAYFRERWTSFLAAFLWAGDAVGGWDNPLNWIAASHLSMGAAWLLGAMACVPRMNGRWGPAWGALAAGCLWISTFTMGAMCIPAAFLPIQWRWTPENRKEPRGRKLLYLVLWMTPLLIAGALQARSVMAGPKASDAAAPVAAPVFAAVFTQFEIALDNFRVAPLFGGPIEHTTWIGCTLIVALALGMATTLRASTARIVLLFLLMVGAYTFAACGGRSVEKPEEVAAWGRYHYLPSLFWCIAVGALVDALWAHGGRRRIAAALAVALVLPLFFARQCILSRSTPFKHQEMATALASRDEFLRFLSDYSNRHDRVARLPDTKVFADLQLLWSEYVLVAHRGKLTGVEFVPVEHFRLDDRRWLADAQAVFRAQKAQRRAP